MRSYKEVSKDENYKPSMDEINAMNDALNLVGFVYNCEPYWVPIAENLYAEAFYNKRAMPVAWMQEDEEFYVNVWFKILENKRDVEIKIGPNILDIVTSQVFKNTHEFCFEACNEQAQSYDMPEEADIQVSTLIEVDEQEEDYEDEEDAFWVEYDERQERIKRNGYDINELRNEVAQKQQKRNEEREMWMNEFNRLVRLSKKDEYIKNWEIQYGSRPESTPYDDVW